MAGGRSPLVFKFLREMPPHYSSLISVDAHAPPAVIFICFAFLCFPSLVSIMKQSVPIDVAATFTANASRRLSSLSRCPRLSRFSLRPLPLLFKRSVGLFFLRFCFTFLRLFLLPLAICLLISLSLVGCICRGYGVVVCSRRCISRWFPVVLLLICF